jgi:hypothetical protein
VINQRTIKTKYIAKLIKRKLLKEVFLKNECGIIAKCEEMTSVALVRKCYQHCFSHPTKNYHNKYLILNQKIILISIILFIID